MSAGRRNDGNNIFGNNIFGNNIFGNNISNNMRSTKLRRKTLLTFTLLIAASTIATCASAGEKKRNAYYDNQFNNYVFAKDCRKLWPSVKGYLAGRGYQIADPTGPDKSFSVESAQKRTEEKLSSERQVTHYLVAARDVDGKGCSIEMTFTRDSTGPNIQGTSRYRYRSTNDERALIQQVEPDRFARIQEEGERMRKEADGK